MAYSNVFKIANGLKLDFTVQSATPASDDLLFINSDGEVVKASSIPATKVTSGGNITEATSSVLTITGGTGAALSNVSIQVKVANGSQGGYLSSADWTTFNSKLTGALTDGYIFVGSSGNLAVGVSPTGAIAITNTGLTSINTNYITNSMINSLAAIAFTKMAAFAGTNLVMATNGSGFATTVTGFTTTIAGYLTNITSDVQSQLNGKLSVTLTSPTNGDVITYNGSAWVNSPSSTGVPTGGSANQVLRKIDATNYNTEWHTLVLADITNITATATELNQFTGVTTTSAQYQYLNTLTSNVQTQLTNKLDRSLAQNAIFVGNASNVPAALAAGTEGYVLTISGGAPAWAIVTGTGTVTLVDVSGGTTGLTTSGGPISTTGTITLAGTLIAANGGTGFASYTVGDILYAATTTTLAKRAAVATGSVLGSAGTGTAPAYLAVSNGLTATATTFKWGGALTADTEITGAFRLDLGTTASKLTVLFGEVGGSGSTILFTQSHGGITRRFGLADGTGVILDLGSDATGDIYQRNSGGALARLASVATGNVLISGGVSTANSWGKVGLTTHVSGTLDILNGGTGINSIGSALQQLRINAGGTAFEYFTPASGLSLSSLTGGSSNNSIDQISATHTWSWNSLSNTKGFLISSTSANASSSTQRLFNVELSGTNANSTQTTYAASILNTHAGTGANNIALYLSASGGVINRALSINAGDILSLGNYISDDAAKGIILKDAAGSPHYWRITVNTSGVLLTTDLGTTLP
jgi:hypothetical protein